MPGCLLAPCTATRLAQGLIHVAFRGLQQPFLRAYLSAEREQLLRPTSSPRWLWSSTAVRTSRCLPVSVGPWQCAGASTRPRSRTVSRLRREDRCDLVLADLASIGSQ